MSKVYGQWMCAVRWWGQHYLDAIDAHLNDVSMFSLSENRCSEISLLYVLV